MAIPSAPQVSATMGAGLMRIDVVFDAASDCVENFDEVRLVFFQKRNTKPLKIGGERRKGHHTDAGGGE